MLALLAVLIVAVADAAPSMAHGMPAGKWPACAPQV
jgi:hypothetical protein